MSGRRPIDRKGRGFPGVLLAVLLIAGFSYPPVAVRAETANRAEMETVCQNWLATIVHQQGDWAGQANPVIRDVREVTADQVVLARCYSISPNGHVVVPVLKELPPVMVSSQVCDLDVRQTDGPAQLLREILQSRAQHIIDTYGSLDAPQSGDEEDVESRKHREQWDRFLFEPVRFAADLEKGETVPRTEVGPLLTTSWHQLEPYNNECPMGDGGRTVVGCMALALAQIMNYHEWPPIGLGGNSYFWNGDWSCGGTTEGEWLGADFEDPYDWENMPNNCMTFTCNPVQEDAVAELCYEVGIAFSNYYGRCYTMPGDDDIAGLMSGCFRYAPGIECETRGSYTAEGWFALIQEEINNDRPMFYGFRFMGGSHAIVCDGWRDTGGENQYHMNYGWGGPPYDAWYAIDELYGHYNPGEDHLCRGIQPGSGFVFSVQPDGMGCYPTIQAAIDAVLEGDIIELVDGVFTGDGNRDVDFHGRAVTVRSESGDPATCIIDCEGDPEDHRGFNFVSGEGPGSILEGITIANGYASTGNAGAAILCANGSMPTIRDCLIRDNAASSDGAGLACSGASPQVTECIFLDNNAGGRGGAVLVADGAEPTLVHCTLVGNGANEGSGVWVGSDSWMEIDNTIVAFGIGGGAVRCEGGSSVAQLDCCDLFENLGGDWIDCVADQFGTNGNISEDPLFCDIEIGNFRLQNDSPCAVENNPTCGQIGALPLGCGHYLLSPDGSGDFPTIQAAIDGAVDGDTIELLDGIYTGDGNRDVDLGGKAITIRSQTGDPKSCVIDCQGTPTERHRAFRFRSGEGAATILDGLTITNGYQAGYSGGAVWCSDGSSPTFRNCIFYKNHTTASGGAAYCSSESDATFDGCTFYENSSGNGGGILAYNSQLLITHCTFAYNTVTAGGGAICSNAPSFEIINTLLAFNTSGGAVQCFAEDVVLTCCDVYGNGGGDWVGCLAGQEGQAGNICEDPLFCHASSGDFRLSEGSPCIGGTPPNEECDLIGAWPVGCNLIGIDEGLPAARLIRLGSAIPNPFTHKTTISYFLAPAAGMTPVLLCIYEPGGRLVRTLIDSRQPAGVHSIRWDGRSDTGVRVAAGIYFYQLSTSGEKRTRRAILVR